MKTTLIQRHESHMGRVISYLIKTEGAKKCTKETCTSCRVLADLTRNIIKFQGSPFMQIASLSLEVHY